MSAERERFLQAIVRSMHCDPSLIGATGVTVKASPARAESHVTSGYCIGEHLVITCDPAAEAMLVTAVSDAAMEPTLTAWAALAQARGGERLGAGRMQLREDVSFPDQPLPKGYTLRTLDRSVAADVALIERLVERSSEEDLDQAEIELDNLDATIEVVIDPTGEIASYASSRDFDLASGFGDIGIMTRPDCRGLGLGSAAVVAMCRRIRDLGDVPLYRCEEDNTGSVALSARLGFTIATQLVAFRFA